jgi:hypothetical protein
MEAAEEFYAKMVASGLGDRGFAVYGWIKGAKCETPAERSDVDTRHCGVDLHPLLPRTADVCDCLAPSGSLKEAFLESKLLIEYIILPRCRRLDLRNYICQFTETEWTPRRTGIFEAPR